MLFRLIGSIFHHKRLKEPEALIDAVITDVRHKITEARIRMLASDLARTKLSADQIKDEMEQDHQTVQQGIERLESTLKELESRRNLLVAKAREADAKLAIEKALMETGVEPADIALELLADKVNDLQAEADAIEEVRQVSNEVRGDSGG